jgi:hypothetical protein
MNFMLRATKVAGAIFTLLLTIAFGVASAQTAGEGAITGTVKDKTGAVIPNAIVAAKNDATGVVTSRTTDAAGIYQISPVIIGTYTVEVTAKGFEKSVQQNITINQNQSFGYNPILNVGSETTEITVSQAPPALETANAQLGGTISANEFADLPVLVAGNQQRDITSFSNLLPGAQAGSRSSLFSGTANRVQEVYLDGLPLTTINQIGDNRPIFNVVPFEGIGQVGALTSGQGVEYQGAGSVDYSMKSGGNKYHGTVADFVRNTIFDTWGFTAPAATVSTVVNGAIVKTPAPKPVDHQNELAIGFGGPITIPHIINGHDKLFFFAAYDRAHTRSAPSYGPATVPTLQMRQGDFSQLLAANGGPGYAIYDPTSQTTCTAHNGGVPCRYQFGYGPGPVTSTSASNPGNAVATGAPINVIPAGMLSPIAQKMQSYLPQPINSGIQNNFLGGVPSGYDNWLYSLRLDYTISPKQTLSGTVTGGNRHAVPYTGTALVLPVPYLGTTISTVAGHWADISDAYTISDHLVNQFKFGFSNFGGPPVQSITQNTQYAASLQGIQFTGVPADGQAVTEFPYQTFAGSNTQTNWGLNSAYTVTAVVNTFTAVDNLLWIKGKHAMTFGIQVQRLEQQQSNYDGPTSALGLNYSPNDTAQDGASAYTANTGYAYASYMLGAVNSSGITLQPFSVLGGRYRPFSPYFQDDYKVSDKLTLNLGIRWDYLPTYQEALGRFSYLNADLVNPVTGNKGTLEFAGNWGGSAVSCGCASPVPNYMKNFGPRIGLEYAPTRQTVIRGSFATVYSHGGGTGGAGGSGTGPSQAGFTSSTSLNPGAAGAAAGPAFYLNNSAGFAALGLSNANFGGPGYSVPAIQAPGAVSQTLNVGNTVNAAGVFVAAGGAPGYADPYLSARAPEFNFWNFGIQQALTNNDTLTINYAGTESHFIAGASNMRGLQSGQINPIYYALGTTLNLPATPTNLATANALAAANNLPAITLPYPGFGLAALDKTGQGQATIVQALKWKPQFSGTTDTWGSQSANASYHSLQVSFAHRSSHGLTFNANYTWSRNIDDAGTQRSGWALPQNLVMGSTHAWAPNRIDRSLSANSVPQNLAAYGVYKLPFGKGAIGGDHLLVRALAGGWSLSEIFTLTSGTPLLVTSSSCSTSFNPTAGTCMPDLNPNYSRSDIKQNGKWGKGITAATLGATPANGGISYANGYIGNSTPGSGGTSTGAATPCATAVTPYCNAGNFMFGNAPRVGQFGLRNPTTYNLNMSVRRSFDVIGDRVKFVFAVDAQNVTNHVTFGGIATSVNSATFGTVGSATGNGGSRDFQFSGRLNF